jgi:hypothetical protein
MAADRMGEINRFGIAGRSIRNPARTAAIGRNPALRSSPLRLAAGESSLFARGRQEAAKCRMIKETV